MTWKSGSARPSRPVQARPRTGGPRPAITTSLKRAYSSDQRMHRTVPVKSSMRNVAYLRPALRPLFAVRTASSTIIPPMRPSVPFLAFAISAHVVRAEAAELLVVLRERVARDVEVERFLLELELLGLGPLGDVGQAVVAPRPCRRAVVVVAVVEHVEEALLAAAAVRGALVGRLVGLGDGGEVRGPAAEARRTPRP